MGIIYCLLITILLLTFYQLYILFRIKKDSDGVNIIPDAKYFELKYQMESYVKIFSVLIAIAAFLGYNTIQKSKVDIEREYVDNLKKYESRLNAIDSTSKENEKFIQSFNIEKEAIKSVLLKTGKDAKDIDRDINLLAANRIRIYIVGGIKFKEDSIYKFSSLKTIDNAGLPEFTFPPELIIKTNTGENLRIKKLTNGSFILGKQLFEGNFLMADENPTYKKTELKFDIWIADYKTGK
jgi:hypothetical protein